MSKILVAVNDKTLREQIDSALEKVDFEVITASDSHQTLDIVHGGETDLIIMTESLPPINEDKLYSRIRRLSDIPIIILGNGEDRLVGVRALVLGADFYMTAPINLNELIARTRALLRRSKKVQRS